MKKDEGKLVGIIGTVIIHLIAGIIFVSFQIKSIQKETHDIIELEMVPDNEIEVKNKQQELPLTKAESTIGSDDEMLNIARNLSSKSEEKINPREYEDMVKNELIKSGKLGVDNFIDEQKRLNDLKSSEKISQVTDSVKKKDADKPTKSLEMAADYKGPTRIYYDLKGRIHTSLPLPIYKCQGSGKVVLTIEVDQTGVVEKANVIASESNTSDACLVETAVNTALISRFNSDVNSPKMQTGTLTYLFVAQ